MVWAIPSTTFFTVIFLSGFSALVYQLIWVRALGLVFGVSSLAVATVVSVFLLGLGVGSYYFGRRSETIRDPLRAYFFVELSIGILSLLCYLSIDRLPIFKIVYEYSYNNFDFYTMSIVRLALSFLILFPPVFAIGGTIPLISKYFLTNQNTFGSRFSSIYYVNTLGACFGALLTGFFLVMHFGVFATLMLAVAVNFLISAVIYFGKRKTQPTPLPRERQAPYSYMLGILFVTGFVSIGYEILWVRILSTYDLSTSQAFALILSGFLLGFSVGAFLVSKSIDRMRDPEAVFCVISVLTALSGALVLLFFQRFSALTGMLAEGLGVHAFVTSLALAFVLSLVPASLMGISFPLGLKIYTNDVNAIGVKTGNIFFVNTMGSVVGSIITGFVLIPFVGMWNTTLILANLSFLVAAYVACRHKPFAKKAFSFSFLGFLLANFLMFSDEKTFHKQVEGFDVIYYEEGLSGTVTAIEKGQYRGLYVDGQNVSGTDPVLSADSKMLGHLPLIAAEKPERALTVGYGTGATSRSMLVHDVLVQAVEIERKIIEAGPLFTQVNHESYADESLTIILDDARNYIDVVDEKFDVIATDVTNLKYKRNPYLYTREYFEIMKAALDEDGVAAAWLPLGGLSFSDLRTLIGTFYSVYPHTTVWYFSQYPTHFVIVLGTPERIRLDLTEISVRMQKESVQEDLRAIGVNTSYDFATMLLLGERDVDALTSGTPMHTDNFPILEFSDMEDYMLVDVEENLNKMLRSRREDLTSYFSGTEVQLEKLDRGFFEVRQHYRNYIERYYRRFPQRRDT